MSIGRGKYWLSPLMSNKWAVGSESFVHSSLLLGGVMSMSSGLYWVLTDGCSGWNMGTNPTVDCEASDSQSE